MSGSERTTFTWVLVAGSNWTVFYGSKKYYNFVPIEEIEHLHFRRVFAFNAVSFAITSRFSPSIVFLSVPLNAFLILVHVFFIKVKEGWCPGQDSICVQHPLMNLIFQFSSMNCPMSKSLMYFQTPIYLMPFLVSSFILVVLEASRSCRFWRS